MWERRDLNVIDEQHPDQAMELKFWGNQVSLVNDTFIEGDVVGFQRLKVDTYKCEKHLVFPRDAAYEIFESIRNLKVLLIGKDTVKE